MKNAVIVIDELVSELKDRGFIFIEEYEDPKNSWEIYDHPQRDLRVYLGNNGQFRVGGKNQHIIDSIKILPERFFRLVDRLICEYPKPVTQFDKPRQKTTSAVQKMRKKIIPQKYCLKTENSGLNIRGPWFTGIHQNKPISIISDFWDTIRCIQENLELESNKGVV